MIFLVLVQCLPRLENYVIHCLFIWNGIPFPLGWPPSTWKFPVTPKIPPDDAATRLNHLVQPEISQRTNAPKENRLSDGSWKQSRRHLAAAGNSSSFECWRGLPSLLWLHNMIEQIKPDCDHKFGEVSNREPFGSLVSMGYLLWNCLGEHHQDTEGYYCTVAEVQ